MENLAPGGLLDKQGIVQRSDPLSPTGQIVSDLGDLSDRGVTFPSGQHLQDIAREEYCNENSWM